MAWYLLKLLTLSLDCAWSFMIYILRYPDLSDQFALVRAEYFLEIMNFEEKIIIIRSRERIVRKTTVYQQLGMFLPQMFLVPPMLSFSNSPKSFSHLPHSSARPVTAPKSNIPHGRPEAVIHMTVGQPAIQEDKHLSLPTFFAPGQTGQTSLWAICCTGCCLLSSVSLPFGIPAHYAWRNREITVNNKLNVGQQCHNIAIKLITFWTA